jgi:hypothetical protein
MSPMRTETRSCERMGLRQASCALPSEVISLFEGLSADTNQREEQRYTASNSFFRTLMNRGVSNPQTIV